MVGLQLLITEQEKKKKLVDNLKLQNFPAFSNTEDARNYYYQDWRKTPRGYKRQEPMHKGVTNE